MLEVIIDTNVIVDAVLDNLNNEDCFEILKLIRTGKIIPVVSRQLLREYNYAMMKVVIRSIVSLSKQKPIDDKVLNETLKEAFYCSSCITDIFEINKKVNVVSKQKICLSDPEDDKIVNLAIDSNCSIIVTKNKSDFIAVEEKNVKTKKSDSIKIYSPSDFCDYYDMYVKLKQFESKSKLY